MQIKKVNRLWEALFASPHPPSTSPTLPAPPLPSQHLPYPPEIESDATDSSSGVYSGAAGQVVTPHFRAGRSGPGKGQGSGEEPAGAAAGLQALGYAVEAPVGLLEADVVSQFVAIRVELTHLPLGLQGIWVGGWGSDSPTQWHQPPHKLPPPLPLQGPPCPPASPLTPARDPGSAAVSSPPHCPPAWTRRLWGRGAGIRWL